MESIPGFSIESMNTMTSLLTAFVAASSLAQHPAMPAGMTHEQHLAQLKKEIESKIKSVLTVSSSIELVPPGTLPRFEMKGQLIKKLYEE